RRVSVGDEGRVCGGRGRERERGAFRHPCRARRRASFVHAAKIAAPAGDAGARAAIHDLLASVVREGTGRAARINGPVEGKTGTSQNHKDAWFIGFTNDIVVGEWVGNDDNTPTRGVTGGDNPARI